MQPHEALTIKELAELFNMSRQAMSQHVKKLDKQFIIKNQRGYTAVLHSGVLQLAVNLGRNELTERLLPTVNLGTKNADIEMDSVVETRLTVQLTAQIEEKDKQIMKLQELLSQTQSTSDRQLTEKDVQIGQLNKLLDQQQQLNLENLKIVDRLQNQIQLLQAPEKEAAVPDPTTSFHISEKEPVDKKWWHFLRKNKN